MKWVAKATVLAFALAAFAAWVTLGSGLIEGMVR